jgi:hypothetical protein
MTWKKFVLTGCVALMPCLFGEAAAVPRFKIGSSLDISKVPSDFPVGFCLLTAGRRQYVAYYDKDRQMTVASRTLDSDQWQFQPLPSKVGWDSHNSITMAVDEDGQLHVSGNMHVVPLIYFRTEKAGDITSLKKFAMTGEQENRVTYPHFLKDHKGRLIFSYRDGSSGDGNTIYNCYDAGKHSWKRLLETPLFDGKGKDNAYSLGPVRGADGWFHIFWVWRETPDCASNHHLSYARSRDLLQWESAFGERVKLPLTLAEKRLWVDPVPSGGGLINGGQRLFFDADGQPLVTYHRSDAKGNMQIYAARPGKNAWTVQQLTAWNKPVLFGGNGTMEFIGIQISGLIRTAPGVLTMTYRHRDYGSGRLVFDEKTLRLLDIPVQVRPDYPAELGRLQSDFPGMGFRRVEDAGDSGDKHVRFVLQWETLGVNRDRPREPPLPQPSMLRLYKLVANETDPTASPAR